MVLLQVGFTLPSTVTRDAVRSYRTFSPLPEGGIFSAALSVGSRPPGITWHLALWSPDFPPAIYMAGDCPVVFGAQCLGFAVVVQGFNQLKQLTP